MTCKCCTEAAKAVDLALDDEALYRNLAALQTFDDCDALVVQMQLSELAIYGGFASHEDVPGGRH
jgi:hypothetical protein